MLDLIENDDAFGIFWATPRARCARSRCPRPRRSWTDIRRSTDDVFTVGIPFSMRGSGRRFRAKEVELADNLINLALHGKTEQISRKPLLIPDHLVHGAISDRSIP
jgi:hypothetical protein